MDAFFHEATAAQRFHDDPFDVLRFRIEAFVVFPAFETSHKVMPFQRNPLGWQWQDSYRFAYHELFGSPNTKIPAC
jgi:hypothetical protein